MINEFDIAPNVPVAVDHKKTLVFGASPNPSRFAFRAVGRLLEHNYEVVPLGIRKGKIHGLDIELEQKQFKDIHTITMYMGAQRQEPYLDYLLSLKPKRIIFNPGAENPQFSAMAEQHGIEVIDACTLVMLSIGNY